MIRGTEQGEAPEVRLCNLRVSQGVPSESLLYFVLLAFDSISIDVTSAICVKGFYQMIKS